MVGCADGCSGRWLDRAHWDFTSPGCRLSRIELMNVRSGTAQSRLILIGVAVLLSLGMGLRQSLGLFMTPVTHGLGITVSQFTTAIMVQNLVWGLSQAPVGALADRFGLRVTMMAGAAVYVAGLIVMATAGGAMALICSGSLIGV